VFVPAKPAKVGIGEITRAPWPLRAASEASLVVVMIITCMPSLATIVWRLVS